VLQQHDNPVISIWECGSKMKDDCKYRQPSELHGAHVPDDYEETKHYLFPKMLLYMLFKQIYLRRYQPKTQINNQNSNVATEQPEADWYSFNVLI